MTDLGNTSLYCGHNSGMNPSEAERLIREDEASERMGKEVEEIDWDEFEDMVEQIIPEDRIELGFAIAKIAENYTKLTGDYFSAIGCLDHIKQQFNDVISQLGGPAEVEQPYRK